METKEHMITEVHSDASLVGRDRAIEGLRHALWSGSFGLSLFPKALKLVLKKRSWKERKIERTGEIAKFERFTDFVVTPPLEVDPKPPTATVDGVDESKATVRTIQRPASTQRVPSTRVTADTRLAPSPMARDTMRTPMQPTQLAHCTCTLCRHLSTSPSSDYTKEEEMTRRSRQA